MTSGKKKKVKYQSPPGKVVRSFKTELNPNDKERSLLVQSTGAGRWAYNWGLARKTEFYWNTGKRLSAIDLHRELNELKKLPVEEGGVPWLYEVSKCAPQEALRNLDKAMSNFFQRCREGAKKKGFPKFKSRKRGIGSFTLTGTISVQETSIQLPNLGTIRLKESNYLPTSGVRILKATVSEKAGRWFVSVQVEMDQPALKPLPHHVIGVDVGISHLAVTSDGEVFENPKALRATEKKLRQLNKSVSRKRKGSNNRKKAAVKLARQHYRVSNIRKDTIHKATSAITKQASTIVIESLNISGMMKNRKLSKAMADAGLGEFHRQLTYKVGRSGGQLIRADRFFPSSKTCSKCGAVKDDLTLSDRTFRCSECGLTIDRDLNAAINLKKLAASYAVSACCPGSSGCGLNDTTKLLVGQAPNTIDSQSGIDGSVLDNG